MKGCRIIFAFLLFILISQRSFAQPCTTLGQTPATAFPVCGTTTFSQASVPLCGGTKINAPCTMGSADYLNDKNPFWYRFTCYTAGTLGFTITPNDLDEDYDWQLFDITGKPANSVFTDPTTFVASNWSGRKGATGASATGTVGVICGDQNPAVLPLFTAMPTLIQGHEYILLVSHFTNTQSGYKLNFGGGTASITDPKEPALQSVSSGCDAMTIRVKLNKNMKCLSIAPDGSDFTITGNPQIIAAIGNKCNSSFDMDEVTLSLKDPLPPGKYTVTIKKGSDGNTLKDNCDREVPEGQSLEVDILPLIPIPMDSIVPVACKPDMISIYFKRLIVMNTAIASDLQLIGPENRNIVSVTGKDPINGMSYIVQVKLDAPITKGGNWQLVLKKGNDGNSFIDECGTEIIPGSKTFMAYDTVSAAFTHTVNYSCTSDLVTFSHNGANNVNAWKWSFDNGKEANTQIAQNTYFTFGNKQVKLAVSNGVCADSITTNIFLDNELKAQFDISTDTLCPNETVSFTNTTIGDVVSWTWQFGNNNTATTKDVGPQSYNTPTRSQDVSVILIARNKYGCSDTYVRKIKLLQSCYVAVPTAFTPNGDGLNDELYPLNGFRAYDMLFRVYNRFGQLIFESKDWNKRWDGRLNGQLQPSGTYVWTFEYTDASSGKPVKLKGTSVLIR